MYLEVEREKLVNCMTWHSVEDCETVPEDSCGLNNTLACASDIYLAVAAGQSAHRVSLFPRNDRKVGFSGQRAGYNETSSNLRYQLKSAPESTDQSLNCSVASLAWQSSQHTRYMNPATDILRKNPRSLSVTSATCRRVQNGDYSI